MSDSPFGRDRGARSAAPIQDPASVAYTRKDFSVHWDYYPEDTGSRQLSLRAIRR